MGGVLLGEVCDAGLGEVCSGLSRERRGTAGDALDEAEESELGGESGDALSDGLLREVCGRTSEGERVIPWTPLLLSVVESASGSPEWLFLISSGMEGACCIALLMVCLLLLREWTSGSKSSKSTMKELKRCCDGERQAMALSGTVGVGGRDGPR